MDVQACFLGKVLANEPVGVLIRASLPRRMRITEVDRNPRVFLKLKILGHLGSSIPRQRFPEMRRQTCHRRADAFAHGDGIVLGQSHGVVATPSDRSDSPNCRLWLLDYHPGRRIIFSCWIQRRFPPDPSAAPGPSRGSPDSRTALHTFHRAPDSARRLAIATGVNIDGGQLVDADRADDWHLDPRIPIREQAGGAVYARNDLDRGHLVRRQTRSKAAKRQPGTRITKPSPTPTSPPQAGAFNQSNNSGSASRTTSSPMPAPTVTASASSSPPCSQPRIRYIAA